MSATLEIIGFLLSITSWLITGSCLANNSWKVSTMSGSLITSSVRYENLWKACAKDSTGVSNCRDFESMLALPGYIQGCRALMIVSLLLGLGGIIVALLGLKCTKIGSTNEQTKGKIALSGGVCLIVSGLCSIIPVSWYAYQITQEFYNPLYGGTKYELGPALYMGWGGAILAILGGSFLCCSCTQGQKGYKYAGPAQGNQRIYKASSTAETMSKAYV
ncbi:claudin-15-like isoform X2 [Polyodon spathula]|uniref:claudin-15-like isoform X2 n=1 Tax=Polyodon spathula TaxID=7913 RepID=UPI001B7F03B6|nr:claudin-15-like isoform X2 [Polyodon spathula]